MGSMSMWGAGQRMMTESRQRVFVLSPASGSGKRARLLRCGRSEADVATRLHSSAGAPLGEVFTFMSGLYFRGKLAYARAFARPPVGSSGVLVIVPGRGLVAPEQPIDVADLRAMAEVAVDLGEPRYVQPLRDAAARVAGALSDRDQVVLLGSVATDKYVEPLLRELGERLHMPEEFVGRGDMSRGSLMLRCVDEGRELTYVPVLGSPRRGPRPTRLPPRQRRSGGDAPS